MPAEERSSRGPERCSIHHGSPSVARCEGCGRRLCLSCAIPVRGDVYGTECLASVLGPSAAPAEPERVPGATARVTVRAAFALAVVATALPWSRFGAGSEPFGAWSMSLRWSALAALAAVAGLLVSLGERAVGTDSPRWDVAATIAGSLVALGSLLAIARPPAFSEPWLGPWLALVAGTLAVTAATRGLLRSRKREPARV